MSMIGHFKQISPQLLDEIIKDPSSLESIIYTDEEDPNELNIDKAWHGIHYLLTGSAWEGEPPLVNVIMGGTEIGDDLGYGAARYLTVNQVKEATEALLKISEEELKTRFNPEEMNKLEIYPPINWIEEEFDYLLGYYEELVAYYKDADEKRNAMLIYIT